MRVEVKKSVGKELKKIDNEQRKKIEDVLLQIRELEDTKDIFNDGKLKGYENYYKIRIGKYRIVYERISNNHIIITKIAHRKHVYEKLLTILFSYVV